MSEIKIIDGSFKSSQFNDYLGQFGDKWVISNHLSGAMIEIDKSIYDLLVANTIAPLEGTKGLNALKNGNFVVPQAYDEVSGFRQMKHNWNTAVRSIGLQIVPTLACNFNCFYCYENQQGNKVLMSEEVMQGIFRYLDDTITPETKLLAVSFYGGEPLLAMKQISYLSQGFLERAAAKKLRYIASLVTNGYLLSREIVNQLINYQVKFVQITLDGSRSFHDKRRTLINGHETWQTIIDNIKYALSTHLGVNLRVNVDKENIDSIEQLCLELKEQGILDKVKLAFGIVSNFGNVCRNVESTMLTQEEAEERLSSETLQTLLQESGDFQHRLLPSLTGCVAVSTNSLIIGPQGELYKCTKTVGSPTEIAGNINNPDMNHPNIKKWEGVGNMEDKTCQHCSVFPLCSGNGCAFDEVIQGKKITACESRLFRTGYLKNLQQLYLKKQKI